MLEIFLFIDPIGRRCLDAERTLLKIVSESDEKIHYRFMPTLNLKVVNNDMIGRSMDIHDLEQHNRTFQLMYRAILDIKAASFQGNKKGRQYLMALQEALTEQGKTYNDALVKELAKQVKLDRDMFLEDRQSDLAKQAFEKDQQLSCEMKITQAPSAVVFNYAKPASEYGLLVENCDSYPLMRDICLNQADSPRQILKRHSEINQLNPAQLRVL
ncbi:dithiol-disulfide isomerase [Lactobacillus selangorensis]|uniref:Dithiol-disulfide isomerase n=1 Tax=Lactobacillus selangorensis TaxID=81857 RepID=A0A0R2G0K3_9LACO|nr:DsbA family protein [Lactobacillus selangorensis]KRN28440.1 dithiol-disulfide isomerase [Lactobacillus selangorensis]KRN31941.1 dithiol-disulfide isomerase [Lactobacillus selangorensis]